MFAYLVFPKSEQLHIDKFLLTVSFVKFSSMHHIQIANLPDNFDLLFLLQQTALGIVTELTVLGGQNLGTLLLSLASLHGEELLESNTNYRSGELTDSASL